jgi:MFS superfamily sulfate permease-like transporter
MVNQQASGKVPRSWFGLRLPVLDHARVDVSAGIVVFLVALPLCLGVALASGAPLLSGVIAGVVGGVIVAWIGFITV